MRCCEAHQHCRNSSTPKSSPGCATRHRLLCVQPLSLQLHAHAHLRVQACALAFKPATVYPHTGEIARGSINVHFTQPFILHYLGLFREGIWICRTRACTSPLGQLDKRYEGVSRSEVCKDLLCALSLSVLLQKHTCGAAPARQLPQLQAGCTTSQRNNNKNRLPIVLEA